MQVTFAKDPITGNNVELTAVKNTDNNKWYLGYVDVAPAGYDSVNNAERSLLVNRNAVLLKPYDNVAIRDTTMYDISNIDLSPYRSISIFVRSTLDQVPTVTLRPFDATAKTWNGSAWVTTDYVHAPADNGFWMALNTKLSLFDKPLEKMTIRAYCTTAPTTGTFTLYIVGTPN